MTPEELQQLAEEEYTYDDEYAYNDPYSVQDRSITNALRNAFIKGYTTCQQTEVEPLQKEIERLKELLEKSVVGYLPEAPANRIWAEYCKDYNL